MAALYLKIGTGTNVSARYRNAQKSTPVHRRGLTPCGPEVRKGTLNLPGRYLREGIIHSARVNALSMGAELLYRRLMSVVDDHGRFHGSVLTIRAACWPTKPDEIRASDVSKWLTQLLAGDKPLVKMYNVSGIPFLEIQDFGQTTRSKSKFPSPPWDASAKQLHTDCMQVADNPITNAKPLRERTTRTITTTDRKSPVVARTEHPKTEAAILSKFQSTDGATVRKIVDAAVQAHLSVDNPKIPIPDDSVIAEAVEVAYREAGSKQTSVMLFTRTVPNVIFGWAKHGRASPGKPSLEQIMGRPLNLPPKGLYD